MTSEYDVIFGLDGGKTAHHGCVLTASDDGLYDRELPQEETSLRAVIERLQSNGEVLVVVDQPTPSVR